MGDVLECRAMEKGNGKTSDDFLAEWQSRIDAREREKQGEPMETVYYRCRRCGGAFERRIGATPPKCCPACGCERWLDPEAVYRFKAWSRKPHGG